MSSFGKPASAPPGHADQHAVFISYRRRDTDALAGRLRDRLQIALPDWTVFMDVESIVPGTDYRDSVRQAIARSSVFLLLIGSTFKGETANRLLEPGDNIVYEIEIALELGLRIIPILVNDAKMPEPQDFPDQVKLVAYRSAIDVRHARFDDDFQNLVQVVTGKPLVRTGPGVAGNARAAALPLAATAIIGAVLAAVIGFVVLAIISAVTGEAVDELVGASGAGLALLAAVAAIGAAAAVYRSRRSGGRPST